MQKNEREATPLRRWSGLVVRLGSISAGIDDGLSRDKRR
jgi:hypothetical protein